MSFSNLRWSFSTAEISRAPDSPGVYRLFSGDEKIYIGKGASIRARLRSHLRGSDGPCTQSATEFTYDVLPASLISQREREELLLHRQRYGRLPRCNDRMG